MTESSFGHLPTRGLKRAGVQKRGKPSSTSILRLIDAVKLVVQLNTSETLARCGGGLA